MWLIKGGLGGCGGCYQTIYFKVEVGMVVREMVGLMVLVFERGGKWLLMVLLVIWKCFLCDAGGLLVNTVAIVVWHRVH